MDYGNTYNREGYDDEAAGRESERNKVLAEEEERKLLQNTYVYICMLMYIYIYTCILCVYTYVDEYMRILYLWIYMLLCIL
jgi:predicted MFS family arabinose efflux permease